jgi:hypothetical protein
VPALLSVSSRHDIRAPQGSRGIFQPCSRSPEHLRMRPSVGFQTLETTKLIVSGTETIYSFLSFPAVWAETGIISQWCGLRTTAAAIHLSMEDAPTRWEMRMWTEAPNDIENVVEFRSLPPRMESLSSFRGKLRVSSAPSTRAGESRRRSPRIEKEFEEAPE